MNIKQSIFGRVSNYVNRENFKSLLKRNGLNPIDFAEVPSDHIEMMETIQNFKQKSNVLLDIGAFNGQFSQTARAFFDFQEIVCFEPNQQQHEQIKKNNGHHAVIENIALSDSTGADVTFYLHEDASMNSTVDSHNEILKKEFPYSNPESILRTTVKTSTLDDYVAGRNWADAVFMIKIDTQGNELNILEQGTKTLQRTEICLIEYMFTSPYKTNYTFEEMNEFMHRQGFHCEGALSIRKRPSGRISAVDFMYVKDSL
jgi:FkbM family methyltransferase